MVSRIFITGATGFIGKALLERLLASGGWQIKALARRVPEAGADDSSGTAWIAGDLLNPESYRAGLENVDTVVHLAASTGKASPSEHESTNVEGTRRLLAAAKAAGVRQFLHVSTIAAAYPDQRWYPYAQSKLRAEELVKASGIASLVLRPTIVLDARSPIWLSLSGIARLPVIPMPGGGRVQVQPIAVTDLVAGIERALSEGKFTGETLDLGGPTPMTFADFMRAIHKGFHGKEPRLVPVPLFPIRAALALIEPLARPVMPVTAGQLAVFANSSTVTANWLHDSLKDRMPGVDEMIGRVIAESKITQAAAVGRASAFEPDAITAAEASTIDREAEVFARYLVSEAPNEYVRSAYHKATIARGLASDEAFSPFDRATLRMARRGALWTRFADSYCALFHRHGALRRKLILLLAILEHTAPYSERFDRPAVRGPIGRSLILMLRGASSVFSLLAGTLLLLPARLLSPRQSADTARGRQQ